MSSGWLVIAIASLGGVTLHCWLTGCSMHFHGFLFVLVRDHMMYVGSVESCPEHGLCVGTGPKVK